jgi:hypothetical protein
MHMAALRRYLLFATLLLGGLLCGSLTGLALARAARQRAVASLPPMTPTYACAGGTWAVALCPPPGARATARDPRRMTPASPTP